MLYPIKKQLVNWVDGMNISKDHLVQTEDYVIDVVRDANNMRLTDYNFGLLPPYKNDKISADFDITERISNHVEIELRKCNAITLGGCRININPADESGYLKLDYPFVDDLNKTSETEEPTWDIILSIHPFERIPAGDPDPEETPPRHPNTSNAYKIFIKPVGQINMQGIGLNQLIIGRVKKIGDRFEVDANYIPPCTSMSSHPELKKYYEQFGKYMNEIETSSHKIIQKIHERETPSDIAKNVQMICEQLLSYIAAIYFNYRNIGRSYSPVETVNIFSSLAHTCFISINFIPKKKREEMLQYFYEWSDVTPGNFIEILKGMLEATYNHNNIHLAMEQTQVFLSVFSELWIRLSTLEYIGQHKENIVVAEKIQKQVTTQKTEWTILD